MADPLPTDSNSFTQGRTKSWNLRVLTIAAKDTTSLLLSNQCWRSKDAGRIRLDHLAVCVSPKDGLHDRNMVREKLMCAIGLTDASHGLHHYSPPSPQSLPDFGSHVTQHDSYRNPLMSETSQCTSTMPAANQGIFDLESGASRYANVTSMEHNEMTYRCQPQGDAPPMANHEQDHQIRYVNPTDLIISSRGCDTFQHLFSGTAPVPTDTSQLP